MLLEDQELKLKLLLNPPYADLELLLKLRLIGLQPNQLLEDQELRLKLLLTDLLQNLPSEDPESKLKLQLITLSEDQD